MRYLVVAAAMVAALAAPAGAHSRTVLDADDSEGPLDVVAARVKHGGGMVTLRLVTYEEWDDARLEGELDYVRFDFDVPGGADADRCVVVQTYPPQAGAGYWDASTVYRDCYAPTPYSSEAGSITRVHRPDAHGIEIEIDSDVLWSKRPKSFRWRALTSYEDEAYPGCEAPDPMPPEHFVGTCWDLTAWNTHRR